MECLPYEFRCVAMETGLIAFPQRKGEEAVEQD